MAARGLPSGTVTFLFTDVEGSTRLLDELGAEAYAAALATHRRVLRDACAAHGGVEVDTQGDAFFFAFPSARDAVGAAVAAQRSHAEHDWPGDAVVRVRMGLHTGEPALGEEGYLGLDVVRAARICTLARGGTILLSESTRSLLGSSLPTGVTVFPRGERHLKDIDEPERIYELDVDGLGPAPDGAGVAVAPTEPAPPSPAAQAVGDLGARLAAQIQEHVARTLERSLGRKASEVPEQDEGDHAAVDDIAARTASLGDQIRARVEAALRAKGFTPPDEG